MQESASCLAAVSAALCTLEEGYGPVLPATAQRHDGTTVASAANPGPDAPAHDDAATAGRCDVDEAEEADESLRGAAVEGPPAPRVAPVALCEELLASLPGTLDVRQASEVGCCALWHSVGVVRLLHSWSEAWRAPMCHTRALGATWMCFEWTDRPSTGQR